MNNNKFRDMLNNLYKNKIKIIKNTPANKMIFSDGLKTEELE